MTVNGEEKLCGKCRRWNPETRICKLFGCKAEATDKATGCSGFGFRACETWSENPAKQAIKLLSVELSASAELSAMLKGFTDNQFADYIENQTERMLPPAWDVAESIIVRLRRAGGGPCELLDGEPVPTDVAIRALRVARAANEGEDKT